MSHGHLIPTEKYTSEVHYDDIIKVIQLIDLRIEGNTGLYLSVAELKVLRPHLAARRETPGDNTNTWDKTCPICGEPTEWRPSGRGKHMGQLCSKHGFVAIRRSPLIGKKPDGIFKRLWKAAFLDEESKPIVHKIL